MTRQPDVDQLVESWLAEGPSQLPDRVVDSIVSQLDQTPRRRLRLPSGREDMNRTMLAVAGIAAALVLGVGGVAIYAGLGLNGPGPAAPTATAPTPSAEPSPSQAPVQSSAPASDEAVFLRRDYADVLVIGVDVEGHERVIARLAEAWGPEPTYPDPAGALSPSGLLVMAAGIDPFDLRWTIFDLLSPEAPPLEVAGVAGQDIDQLDYSYFGSWSEELHGRTDGRASWGPGDRLAIQWFERIPQGGNGFGRNDFVSFVEGRTGEAISVDIDDALVILPYWASDGSGIVVDGLPIERVLRDDGTFVSAPGIIPESSCGKLLQSGNELLSRADYAASPCISPDGLLLADTSVIDAISPTARLTIEATGGSRVVAGQFVGWLERTP